jgi:hypothetical protein
MNERTPQKKCPGGTTPRDYRHPKPHAETHDTVEPVSCNTVSVLSIPEPRQIAEILQGLKFSEVTARTLAKRASRATGAAFFYLSIDGKDYEVATLKGGAK